MVWSGCLKVLQKFSPTNSFMTSTVFKVIVSNGGTKLSRKGTKWHFINTWDMCDVLVYCKGMKRRIWTTRTVTGAKSTVQVEISRFREVKVGSASGWRRILIYWVTTWDIFVVKTWIEGVKVCLSEQWDGQSGRRYGLRRKLRVCSRKGGDEDEAMTG